MRLWISSKPNDNLCSKLLTGGGPQREPKTADLENQLVPLIEELLHITTKSWLKSKT